MPDKPKIIYRNFTNARIGLERAGTSSITRDILGFKAAHALAKDAVHTPFDSDLMLDGLKNLGLETIVVESEANDRNVYLKRPDLGRKLSPEAREKLTLCGGQDYDLVFVLADGLSSAAIHNHGIGFIAAFLPKIHSLYSVAPIVLVKQGRVAIGDETGHLLKAKMVVVIIGERPGLSSPDSMGVYLTYNPAPGLTDDARNCISNIHANGLSYFLAADKLFNFINKAFKDKRSGVQLKDDFDLLSADL